MQILVTLERGLRMLKEHAQGFEDIVPAIVPRLRRVFVFHCPERKVREGGGVPMVFDPSGVWVRREGPLSTGVFLCGMVAGDDPDFEGNHQELEHGGIADQHFFERYIWEPLATRIPAFENLRVQGGWHGFYDFHKLDENAIIGRHPELDCYYFAAGFSGHGIQHCPPVGCALAELILRGEYLSMDLSRFGYERVIRNIPLREKMCY